MVFESMGGYTDLTQYNLSIKQLLCDVNTYDRGILLRVEFSHEYLAWGLENCVNNDECDFCNNEDISEKKLPEL